MPDANLSPRDAARDLLPGVLALQLEFLGRDELMQAMRRWDPQGSQSLGELLVEAGALTESRLALLNDVVREYLSRYQDDAVVAFAALCRARAVHLDVSGFAATTPGSHLATLPTTPADSLFSTLDAPPLGFALTSSASNRFRILRPHASGALGQVFVAMDDELFREVALKEMREPYAHIAECRARFLLEAEITGSLEHPGIVPVYSLGRHLDGRPYYAMRFIRGQSLHEAIQVFHQGDADPNRDASERALALRGLLGRFVAVCHAIAYAHSRGVIHRDIKPSNVMLGGYGETLVVDWGLAKALDRPVREPSSEVPVHPVSAASTHPTVLGQAVGTPAFMPPEQAAGRVDAVGQASDIYSLGATLYHLLTGEPPFHGATTAEILSRVQAHLFTPPRQVKPQVPAPLEAIVLKAMAYNPLYRYGSANDMAREVECWLADEPVRAYREPLPARGLRWLRRHRPLVAGVGALLLTAVVGLTLGLYAVGREQEQTARERDLARRHLELAQHNLDLARDAVDKCFILATEHPLLQQDQMRAVRKLLLERALPFYQGFRAQKPDDDRISFEDANNHFKVALITAEIGRKADALDTYARAHAGMQALAEAHPDNDGYRADLARVANNRGVLQRDTGQWTTALASLEEARRLRADLVARHPESTEYRSDLASTCNNLGVLLRDRNHPQEALDNFEKARDLFAALAEKNPKQTRYSSHLAATLHNLGLLHAETGDSAEAMACYEQARAIRDRLVKADPALAEHRANLASTLLNLGAQLHIDAPTTAQPYYEQARLLLEGLVSAYPDVAEYRADLARACNNLGVLLRRPGKTEASLPLHRRALEILDPLVREHSSVPSYRIDLAGTCVNLGQALRDRRAGSGPHPEAKEALPQYDRAIREIQPVLDLDPASAEARAVLCNAHWGRAEALGKLDRHRDALADWQKALDLARGEDRELVRQDRAFALAFAGDHVRAMAEVDDLLQGKGVSGRLLYNLACVTALAARALAADASRPPAGRQKQADALAERAVELLQRARLARLFRDPAQRTHLRDDRDLDYLRDRADFKQLVAELASPPEKND